MGNEQKDQTVGEAASGWVGQELQKEVSLFPEPLKDIVEKAKPPTDVNYSTMARCMVVEYFNKKVEKTDNFRLTISDTYCVWFAKTLQNWKALVSTTVSDGMYYEITYDGNLECAYLDAYKKFDNVVIIPEGF